MIPALFLVYLYGIFIIIVAIKGLIAKKYRNYSDAVMIIILLAAGVLQGMFLSGGALIVIYAVIKFKDKSVIRSNIAPVWIILNGFIFIQDIVNKNFSEEIIILSLFALVPLLCSFIIGGIIHKKIKQTVFVKLTYILLIISGIMLFI